MPKRNFKKKQGNSSFNRDSRKPNNDNDRWQVDRNNEIWENYYKSLKIIPESEWDDFKKACQTTLPLTFRITGSAKHAQEIRNIFLERHFNNLNGKEYEGIDTTPKQIEFYPDKLGWQIDLTKSIIKKDKNFAKFQRFLVVETEAGNISRQEAVSMIPPLLLDVQPHHYVLDMCAAPGSKTAQLVEALHSDIPTGFVMANDSDYKRSHMLVHQVKRLNSPNFVVVNHDAQLFPRIKLNNSEEHLKFDRVLCDVPCSGDGTMRKNFNVWKDFRIGNALGLHNLQVNILNRGLHLLKKGGRLVYSTCSLSPIENEAVVASALRKWGDKIKLVDVSNELPGLKRANGISDWLVYGKDIQIKQKGDDETISESCFPPAQDEVERFHLEKCVRVYPHLQNTGGFFITVFEKIEDGPTKRTNEGQFEEKSQFKKQKISNVFTNEETPEPSKDANNGQDAKEIQESESKEEIQESESKEETPEVKEIKEVTHVKQKGTKLPRDANEEPFVYLDPNNPELLKCWPFYGFKDSFNKDCCLVRNSTGEPVRTIYYTSKIIKEILTIKDQKLKLIHSGVKLFVSQSKKVTDTCCWRVQTESFSTIEPFLDHKRNIDCDLSVLKFLFFEAFPKIDSLIENGIDSGFVEKLKESDEGCLFITVKRGSGLEDIFLPVWKGKTNINLMVSKQDTQELLLRVFDIETSSKDLGKEKIYQEKVEAAKKAKLEGETSATSEPNETPDAESVKEEVK
ncbi:unnamed protein product [Candida verbasci]|uniref:SAM-dependent MTase RsmB/NOP-type domain-containing protein n=1 Tax=Candida verbasci TaxID=1227364 RepID=A0A9W4TRQ9_9ASCO|nr:unnamed protein product [Candida verbasci]